MITMNIKEKAIPTAVNASLALAQFALLGCVVELKAQTNNKTIPTNGMADKNTVKNHSPKVITLFAEPG